MWQSPGSSEICEKRTNALTNCSEKLGDCHTSLRTGSQWQFYFSAANTNLSAWSARVEKKHTAKAVCHLVKLYCGKAKSTAPLRGARKAAVSQFDQSLYSKDYFYYSYWPFHKFMPQRHIRFIVTNLYNWAFNSINKATEVANRITRFSAFDPAVRMALAGKPRRSVVSCFGKTLSNWDWIHYSISEPDVNIFCSKTE